MRLVEKIRQHRRDFIGLYQCESCGAEVEVRHGYDDRNFHDNVIPRMECPKCGETRVSQGLEPQRVETHYHDWETI